MRDLKRLPKARNLIVTVRDDKGKFTLFQLLRQLHKEASKFCKEQEGFRRIKLQLKISVM